MNKQLSKKILNFKEFENLQINTNEGPEKIFTNKCSIHMKENMKIQLKIIKFGLFKENKVINCGQKRVV